MELWIDDLKERGGALADRTRHRGLDALGRVSTGALDWHQTLEARRAELEKAPGPWFAGLRLRLIDRFDRALISFGERVRSEIQRLAQLELGTRGPVDTELDEAKSPIEPDAKATKAKTARPKAKAKTARPRAKAKTAKPKARATKAKAKTTAKPKATRAKATKAKAKPARSTRFLMPIADYDTLTAKEILAELPRLTAAQKATVHSHELAHKARKTVLGATKG